MAFFNSVGQPVNDVIDGAADAAGAVGAAVGGAIGAAGAAIAGALENAQPGGGSGVLRIDADQVEAAIGIFEDALDKLTNRVRDAKREIEARPVANDQVSGDAATAFNHAAMGGQGTAIAVWTSAITELESIVRQLKSNVRTTRNTDELASQPFTSGLQG